MEDTKVTFETAKLAKEKEFPQSRKAKGKFRDDGSIENLGIGGSMIDTCKEWYERPTQSLLAKWLREKHKIYVTPRESYAFDQTLEFVCSVNNIFVNHGNNDEPINRFKTYEEAYEKGLQEALKLIK